MPLSEILDSLKSAVWSAPEFAILMVLLLGSVVWSTRAGALPGNRFHLLGDLAECISWACLYVGLGMIYRFVSTDDRKTPRGLLRNLGICLLLAITATYVLMLLLRPSAWHKFFYLRYLSIPVFVGFWCAVILPVETRKLYRLAGTMRMDSALLPIAILLASAAFLVSFSDLALEFGVTSGSELQRSIILKKAWVANILILFAAYVFAFVVTSRLSTTLLLVSPFYIFLGIATLVKLKYMHAAVSPLDLISVPEFLPQFEAFFGPLVLVASICMFIVWIVMLVALWRINRYRIPLVFRRTIGVFSLVILLAVPAIYAWPIYVNENDNDKLFRRIGAPDFHPNYDTTRNSGFLLTFLSEIPSSFIHTPPDYSPATVADAMRYFMSHKNVTTERSRVRNVNLIVYMVESFMDPKDLGWDYTSDPIPNIRFLHRIGMGGYAIVPERFGGSCNSEFEALTGMTSSFLPARSLPYRQFVRNSIPSLPNALKKNGYRTTAVQADPKNWFNREKVYEQMGFDKVVWLSEKPGIERGRLGWPSDKAVVENIIQASQGVYPFFIFAFPSTTHSPYNTGAYRNSDLDVVNPPPGDAGNEVKEYINALRVSDRAIGTLIEYFRHQQAPTIIAIMGDHLPPLSGEAYNLFEANLLGKSKAEQDFKVRRVPFLIWSNFNLHAEKTEISLNALPSLLLELMNIMPQGFLSVSNTVRVSIPVISNYLRGVNGSVWDRKSLPIEPRTLLDRYQLLQYDVLLGKQYSLKE